MINKFLKITLVLIISLKLFSISFADEFVFEVTELKITDNGNIYKGINKGKIITETKLNNDDSIPILIVQIKKEIFKTIRIEKMLFTLLLKTLSSLKYCFADI